MHIGKQPCHPPRQCWHVFHTWSYQKVLCFLSIEKEKKKSLMKVKNKGEERQDPRGTPLRKLRSWLVVPFQPTFCFLANREGDMRSKKFRLKNCRNLYSYKKRSRLFVFPNTFHLVAKYDFKKTHHFFPNSTFHFNFKSIKLHLRWWGY